MATKATIEISLKDISLATGQYIILCARTEVSCSCSQNVCNPIGHVDLFGRDINSLKHLFGFVMCTELLFTVKL